MTDPSASLRQEIERDAEQIVEKIKQGKWVYLHEVVSVVERLAARLRELTAERNEMDRAYEHLALLAAERESSLTTLQGALKAKAEEWRTRGKLL
jgi:hypothetical protein